MLKQKEAEVVQHYILGSPKYMRNLQRLPLDDAKGDGRGIRFAPQSNPGLENIFL